MSSFDAMPVLPVTAFDWLELAGFRAGVSTSRLLKSRPVAKEKSYQISWSGQSLPASTMQATSIMEGSSTIHLALQEAHHSLLSSKR